MNSEYNYDVKVRLTPLTDSSLPLEPPQEKRVHSKADSIAKTLFALAGLAVVGMMVGLAVVVIKNPHPDIKIVVPLVTCGIGVATVFTFAGKGVLDYSEYKKEKEKHMSSQELMNVVDDSTRYEPLEYTTL